MKKLLLQLDCDKFASTFDAVTAYEAGVDNVLSYGGVTPEDVAGLLQGVMFTRPRADLRQTAVFIGGRRVDECERLLEASQRAMFNPYCLSVMLDSNGCNTASAAAVALIEGYINLRGLQVAVIGGFGPVGLRAARLMAGEGARVQVTGLPREIFPGPWNEARAEHDLRLAQAQAKRFGFAIQPAKLRQDLVAAIQAAAVVLAVGPSGVQLVTKAEWIRQPELKILADFNVAPPYGIQGIEPQWRGEVHESRIMFGGLGIGHMKMRVHKAAIMNLFENEQILDAEEIYKLAKNL